MPSPRQRMAPADRHRVRRLDIAWAHKYMIALCGQPFVSGPSDVNGKMYTADENALIALHKLRTEVGSKKEMVASREWLRAEGLTGLFGATLASH